MNHIWVATIWVHQQPDTVPQRGPAAVVEATKELGDVTGVHSLNKNQHRMAGSFLEKVSSTFESSKIF